MRLVNKIIGINLWIVLVSKSRFGKFSKSSKRKNSGKLVKNKWKIKGWVGFKRIYFEIEILK